MRYLNCNILSAADGDNRTGGKVDSNQLISASFHVYFGDALAAGTVKIQASNDEYTAQYLPSEFTPTNWVDIPNQSAVITVGGSVLLTIAQMSYRWIRAIYSNTGFAAKRAIQDLTYTADAAGPGGTAITIAYTTGATAGSEVVTVMGNAISVQIESGVSTATQVKAAVDSSAPASALISVAITGTGGTAQTAPVAPLALQQVGVSTININMMALSV